MLRSLLKDEHKNRQTGFQFIEYPMCNRQNRVEQQRVCKKGRHRATAIWFEQFIFFISFGKPNIVPSRSALMPFENGIMAKNHFIFHKHCCVNVINVSYSKPKVYRIKPKDCLNIISMTNVVLIFIPNNICQTSTHALSLYFIKNIYVAIYVYLGVCVCMCVDTSSTLESFICALFTIR